MYGLLIELRKVGLTYWNINGNYIQGVPEFGGHALLNKIP
jgi:hypothetical protein